MPGRLPISLLSAVAWGNLVNALVPADPTITAPAILPRQNNDRFIGWVEASGTWFSETCQDGLTWYQDGKYAQCCPATLASCYAPTACVSGSLIYPYSDISSTRTIACTENYDNTLFSICNTAFIFENFGDSNPKTDIVCGDQSVNWSYYRKVPATATEPVVSSAAPSSLLPSGNPAQSGGSSESSSIPSPKKEESKAWIAGAVVGPIAGLALIGGLVFFFLRRRKNKTPTGPQSGSVMAPTDPSQPPAGVGGYTDAKPQMQQQGSFNPNDPYNQNGYGQAPLSPAPQYSSTYGSSPGSPPPQNAYGSDVKYGHAAEPTHPNAVEIGGGDVSHAPPAAGASAPPPTTNAYTAELPTEASHNRS